jgi:hypothetical protein
MRRLSSFVADSLTKPCPPLVSGGLGDLRAPRHLLPIIGSGLGAIRVPPLLLELVVGGLARARGRRHGVAFLAPRSRLHLEFGGSGGPFTETGHLLALGRAGAQARRWRRSLRRDVPPRRRLSCCIRLHLEFGGSGGAFPAACSRRLRPPLAASTSSLHARRRQSLPRHVIRLKRIYNF